MGAASLCAIIAAGLQAVPVFFKMKKSELGGRGHPRAIDFQTQRRLDGTGGE